MILFWSKWKRRCAVLVTALALFALAGCSSTQNILEPFSPAAEESANLFTGIFIVAALIFLLVEGLLIFFVLRYQRRAADEHPEQYHGNTKLEVTWTIIPALILVVVFAFTIRTMAQVGPTNPPAQGIPVKVIGHQWWWEVQYDDGKVKYANDLHIPVGQVVNIELTSENVIHSFWVPKLMGKTDVVPGHTNKTWLYTNHPGTYDGQCAEFCGAQHANMLFKVVASSRAEYDAWLKDVQAPPVEPAAGSLAAQGKEIFLDPQNLCIGCHTIDGTKAVGVTGPNLTHVASRTCIAGCLLDFNHANLVKWLSSPQAVKPNSLMKINPLTPDQVNALSAYLESLK
ncbi:MAG: cytochrome c oxidase subunit II [Chloroflexi bacterium]|nr:cytochrome c oxidase subunit II [Chloroflexota bacterium]